MLGNPAIPVAVQRDTVDCDWHGTSLAFRATTCLGVHIDVSSRTTFDGLLGLGQSCNSGTSHLCRFARNSHVGCEFTPHLV
jgi:hypothetical protein